MTTRTNDYMATYAADVFELDFDKVWEEWGSDYFKALARKFDYLAPDKGTAEDLFQLLWLNVWTKAVDRWPDFYEKSKNPVFQNWVKLLAKNYTIDLARKSKTGPQTMQKRQLHLDAPVSRGEEGGATMKDFMESTEKGFARIESEEVINQIMDSLVDQPELQKAVEILLRDEPDTMQAKMQIIQDETGESPHKIMRLLRENPQVRQLLEPSTQPA